MVRTQHSNGVTYKFTFFFLIFSLLKIYKLMEGKRKCFLFQLNRFENGYVEIYFRFLFRYSLTINGIKLAQGKRYFLGNYEAK